MMNFHISLIFELSATRQLYDHFCVALVLLSLSLVYLSLRVCFWFTVFDQLRARLNRGSARTKYFSLHDLFVNFGHKIAVKAVTAAQLSMASHGVYSVTLDEAIEAMRLTAADMSVKYKETSLSVGSPSF